MATVERAPQRPWPFAGRAGDLAFGHRLLLGPPARGLVLAGAQGIGKTRLAAEIRRAVEAAGRRVFHVAASPAISALPMGALLPLVEVPSARGDTLRSSLVLASRRLADLADGEPFVLSIDDGHLLDDSSATVIHQLAATHGVAVLMTVRVDLASPRAVRALWKDGLAERIDLEPLDDQAVGQVLAGVLDQPVDVGTRQVLASVSGGNPLFLRELILGSVESGTLREVGGQWRLGEGGLNATARLIELVEDRLDDVDPDARDVLNVLALGGPEALPLIDALDPDGAITERLEERRLVSITSVRRRRSLELVHPVHAEVLRRGMTARQTAGFLRRLADALEDTGARRRQDTLRLASLRVDGGGPIDPELMCRAAHQAMLNHDDLLAERLARAAHDAGGGPEAVHLLGGCMARTGRMDAADELFTSAALDGATERQRALICIEHAEVVFYGQGRLEQAIDIVDRAHEALDDPTWRDQLVATASAYKLMSGDASAALADADRVIADGRQKAVVSAALIAAPALVLVGRPVDAVEAATQGLQARATLEDPQGTTYDGMLLMAQAFALSESGQIADAIETARLGFEVSVAEGVVLGQAWFGLMLGRAYLLSGDLTDATRWFREGRSGFEELAQAGLERWCQGGVVWAAALAGDTDRANGEYETFSSMERNHILMMEPEMVRVEAWLSVAGGDVDTALERLAAAADLAADTNRITLEMAALHDFIRLDRAEHGADRLLALAGRVQGTLAEIRAAHARAALTKDAAALTEVASRFEEIGSTMLAAEALAQTVPLLTKSSEAREAARNSRRAHELAAVGGSSTPALALAGASAVLTDREREIAELAASGTSSKEIAERLFLSRRTIDNHLHRVYEKLGVSGRDELPDSLS